MTGRAGRRTTSWWACSPRDGPRFYDDGVEENRYNNGWYIEGDAKLYAAFLSCRLELCGVKE
jgi:hypothetical protein